MILVNMERKYFKNKFNFIWWIGKIDLSLQYNIKTKEYENINNNVSMFDYWFIMFCYESTNRTLCNNLVIVFNHICWGCLYF